MSKYNFDFDMDVYRRAEQKANRTKGGTMKKELKTTVSFRIKPTDKEAVRQIGHGSFSRGISTILSTYPTDAIEDTLDLKMREAEELVKRVIANWNDKAAAKELEEELKALKKRYLAVKIKRVKDLLKEIKKSLEEKGIL